MKDSKEMSTISTYIMVTIIQKMEEIEQLIRETDEQIKTAEKLKNKLEEEYSACADFVRQHEIAEEHDG